MDKKNTIDILIEKLFTTYAQDEQHSIRQRLGKEYEAAYDLTDDQLKDWANDFLEDGFCYLTLKTACELSNSLSILRKLPWNNYNNFKDLFAAAEYTDRSVTSQKIARQVEEIDISAEFNEIKKFTSEKPTRSETTAQLCNESNSTTSRFSEQSIPKENNFITEEKSMDCQTLFLSDPLVTLIAGALIGFVIGRITEKKHTLKSINQANNTSASYSQAKKENWSLQLLIFANRCPYALSKGDFISLMDLNRLIKEARAFRCQKSAVNVPIEVSNKIEWNQSVNVLLTFTLTAEPIKKQSEIKKTFGENHSIEYEKPDSAKTTTNLIRLLANAKDIQLTTVAPCPSTAQSLEASYDFIKI